VTRPRRRRRKRQTHWNAVPRRPRSLDFWRLSADLEPVTRRSLAGQAADQIRRRITVGDLKPGQRIESSRKLAGELQISLPVLREALAALSYLGMIDVRQGIGIFVAQRQRRARVLRVSHRHARRSELHALRATLASETAAIAATRKRTVAQHLDLNLMLEERHRAVLAGSPTAFTRADLAFHALVASVAGSPLHAALEQMAGSALRTDLAGRARRLARDSGLAALHQTLVEAIDASDADAARLAARAIAAAEGAAPD
jgi:GntR family transcriptional repressor for pyruvate dehydrogenase complex